MLQCAAVRYSQVCYRARATVGVLGAYPVVSGLAGSIDVVSANGHGIQAACPSFREQTALERRPLLLPRDAAPPTTKAPLDHHLHCPSH